MMMDDLFYRRRTLIIYNSNTNVLGRPIPDTSRSWPSKWGWRAARRSRPQGTRTTQTRCLGTGTSMAKKRHKVRRRPARSTSSVRRTLVRVRVGRRPARWRGRSIRNSHGGPTLRLRGKHIRTYVHTDPTVASLRNDRSTQSTAAANI